MPSNPISYIVIEVNTEKEEADLVGLLVTKTKSTFIRTENIFEYALKQVKQAKEEQKVEKVVEKVPTPAPVVTEPEDVPPVVVEPFVDRSVGIKRERVEDVITLENDPPPPPPKRFSPIVASRSTDLPLSLTEQQPTSSNGATVPVLFEPDESSLDWIAMQLSNAYDTDNINQYTEQPTSSINTATICAICKSNISSAQYSYVHRSFHAMTHTNINRFQCPYTDCDYKSKHANSMKNHLGKKHGTPDIHVPESMTDAEKQELREMAHMCFPAFK